MKLIRAATQDNLLHDKPRDTPLCSITTAFFERLSIQINCRNFSLIIDEALSINVQVPLQNVKGAK